MNEIDMFEIGERVRVDIHRGIYWVGIKSATFMGFTEKRAKVKFYGKNPCFVKKSYVHKK